MNGLWYSLTKSSLSTWSSWRSSRIGKPWVLLSSSDIFSLSWQVFETYGWEIK